MLALDAVIPSWDLAASVDGAGRILGATSGVMLVADYGLVSLHPLGAPQPLDEPTAMGGTMAGRAFSSGDVVRSADRVWIPITEGAERMGVLELAHPDPMSVSLDAIAPIVRLLVLTLSSRRRYTDALARARRSAPLSLAAEIQWSLLPPLACDTPSVSLSGILEPAYSIGGDSFDYALNSHLAEFAIIDAVGHGMAAVLISTVAINGLRNARREGQSLETAYLETGSAIAEQFGASAFVTGQIGSLDTRTGQLTWLNAGHPPPLLVRDGHNVGELVCEPSFPMGLGGHVSCVAVEQLQPGDRVLFYTDGVTETRSRNRTEFGVDRLTDFLVRSTLQNSAPAETLRQLSTAVMEYSDPGLSDDATLLLVEYHGAPPSPHVDDPY